MATAEIERTTDDIEHDSTSFRLLPSRRGPRIRSVEPGQDLGTALRRARRRRRVSLAQAAEQTRIAVRYLAALERGAPSGEFPAPIHSRAFLREYARFLRLDPEPLLHLLGPYEPPPVASSLAVLRRAAPRSERRGRLLALGGAAVLSALLVLGAGQTDPAPTVPTPTLAPLPAGAAVVPEAPSRLDSDIARSLPVAGVLKADLRTDARSWLRITVDGEVVFEAIAPAGWSRSFDGSERIEMLIGNAGGVELSVGGRAVPRLGAPGEVRRLIITLGPEGPVVRNLPRAG